MELLRIVHDDNCFKTSLTNHEVLRLLNENDSAVNYIRINIDESSSHPTSNAALLLEVGRAIANPDLTKLTNLGVYFNDYGSNHGSRIHEALLLFRNIAKNRCLQSLKLEFSAGDVNRIPGFLEVLKSFIAGNSTLKSLDVTTRLVMPVKGVDILMEALQRRDLPLEKIRFCQIGQSGVGCMTTFFSHHPDVAPQKLLLERNWVQDQGCESLSKTICNENVQLEELHMRYEGIEVAGLELISAALASRGEPLQRLVLEHNPGIWDDKGLIAIAEAFQESPNLIPDKLGLASNRIGPNGLRSFGQVLLKRRSPLESLHLNNNRIYDASLMDFLMALHRKPQKTPKILDLSGNNIERGGVLQILALLRRQECSLEQLEMNYVIDDDLATDRTTRSLTRVGWDSIASVLCDARDIPATYFASNHTITKFGSATDRSGQFFPFRRHPHNIRLYLAMNSLEDKRKVAMMKVVYAHFAGNFCLDLFEDMSPSLII
eukprot:CAMPEP_0171417102 /NCGR_PEP_ID=MMETSP0880-20121228/40432_1 /TAXON_ID=67004 /ORGANISM="Thalassiosira weissflogii, Strain CCMP1336" /LENGTH=488 /DNA_ID=CAMNT_0011935359 /DNA_START=112 /DNA_END=1575 /DNA_ORIENTATION=+